MAVLPTEVIARAWTSGRATQEMIAVAGAVNRAAYAIIGGPDSGQIGDLKGKPVGTGPADGALHQLTRRALKSRGLADGDLKLLAFPKPDLQAASVMNGTAVAALVDAAYSARLQASGLKLLGQAYDLVPEFQSDVVATRPDWAFQNEAVAVRFVRALIAADRWIAEPRNKIEAVDLLATSLGVTSVEAGRAYEQYVERAGAIPKASEVDVAGARAVLDMLIESGAIKQPAPDVTKIVDGTYTAKAR